MKIMALAGLAAVALVSACTTAAVYQRNDTLPVQQQADLVQCEARATQLFPVNMQPRTTAGFSSYPLRRACRGPTCRGVRFGVQTVVPVSTYDANEAARSRAIQSCMAQLNYRRLTLDRCTPEELSGATFRPGGPSDDACAARTESGRWIVVDP
ncbi:hypothetical protein [Pseudoruegeria sp. HB172150]|uniref:hypothetical protein n=1 Tax=Pseudoruegeria sp. HB172150 TaxID=2721164 RepID=UPI0015573B10|nr:hypothetical protein [Pseudoruegeria sp. HB172150]